MKTYAWNALVLITATLAIGAGSVSAQTVDSYSLDVTFHPDDAMMEGIAVVTFVAPLPVGENATFYLHGELSVDSIVASNRTLAISQDQVFYPFDCSMIATKTEINPADALTSTLTVYYSGYFHESKARSPSNYMRIDSEGVLLRSYGYSLWFPMFLESGQDDPNVDFSEVTIRTPKDLRSVFVGHRVSDEVVGDWRVTRWQANDTRLRDVQCSAQDVDITENDAIHIYHYRDPGSVAVAGQILAFSSSLTELFGQHFRRSVSADELYIVEMPRYGDISSANVTGLSEQTWTEFATDEYAKRTLAHELVHPFVSVPVSRDDSLYALEIEGFPSYFYLPVLGDHLGDAFYTTFMDLIQQRYLEKRETGKDRRGRTLPPAKPLLSITADDISEYKDNYVLSDRALLFFDYLYRAMGRDTFYEFTSSLFNRDGLTTASFRELIEAYEPGSRVVVERWLGTNEYPVEFRR